MEAFWQHFGLHFVPKWAITKRQNRVQISDFHTKYCSNQNKKCLVPSLEDWYVEGKPNPPKMQKRVLEFRRYRNSNEVQNFENARYFLGIFPEAKGRLCKNPQANRLRGLYDKEIWKGLLIQLCKFQHKHPNY